MHVYRLDELSDRAVEGMWTLAYYFHEDRTPTHGYEATRQAAIQMAGATGLEPATFGVRGRPKADAINGRCNFSAAGNCPDSRRTDICALISSPIYAFLPVRIVW